MSNDRRFTVSGSWAKVGHRGLTRGFGAIPLFVGGAFVPLLTGFDGLTLLELVPADHVTLNGSGDPAICGHPNPVWFCDSRLWNEVMGGDPDREATGILCPSCFADAADAHFDGGEWRITGWKLVPEFRRR